MGKHSYVSPKRTRSPSATLDAVIEDSIVGSIFSVEAGSLKNSTYRNFMKKKKAKINKTFS